MFLRQAQDRRPLRRTVQVRLGTTTLRLPGGTLILFALAALRSVPQAGSQFRGLTTAIHEISGLDYCNNLVNYELSLWLQNNCLALQRNVLRSTLS
ncbi:MAG: hypothetical protein WBG51_05200 [Syntrophobacteria bacterium]